MIRKYKNLIPKVPASCFIFPTAEIIGSVELGEDVIVYPGTVVRAGYGKITIGNKTNLQENVTFHVETGYDIHVGAGVTIGHNAIIHGCTVGSHTLIGMGSILLDGAKIGNHCIVGAGALVTGKLDAPDGSMILGSPAKVLRPLKPEEIEGNRAAMEEYLEAAAQYRKEQEAR